MFYIRNKGASYVEVVDSRDDSVKCHSFGALLHDLDEPIRGLDRDKKTADAYVVELVNSQITRLRLADKLPEELSYHVYFSDASGRWVLDVTDYSTGFGVQQKDILVPLGVEALADRAFSLMLIRKNVRLSNTVKVIGEGAFFGSSIRSIDLNRVNIIGRGAFSNCTKLEEVNIPSTVSSLPVSCFSYSGVKKVTLHEGLKEICNGCFENCTSLKSIRIPSSVKSMGMYCFSKCANLREIYIDDIALLGVQSGISSLGNPCLERIITKSGVYDSDFRKIEG